MKKLVTIILVIAAIMFALSLVSIFYIFSDQVFGQIYNNPMKSMNMSGFLMVTSFVVGTAFAILKTYMGNKH